MPESASSRVIRAVAEATDTDPADLPPLYDAVDPDALNELFRTRTVTDGVTDVVKSGPVVQFPYAGRDVSVRRDGVSVRERP